MSADDQRSGAGSGGGPGAAPGSSAGAAPGGGQAHAQGEPTEEELRERLEQELRRLRVQDVLLQSVVSLINLTSRRIAKDDERDLEQAQVGIEAIRALVDLLDPEPAQQVRNALSELQMSYAKHSGGASGTEAGPGPSKPDEQQSPGQGEGRRPSGLWTPPGSG